MNISRNKHNNSTSNSHHKRRLFLSFGHAIIRSILLDKYMHTRSHPQHSESIQIINPSDSAAKPDGELYDLQ